MPSLEFQEESLPGHTVASTNLEMFSFPAAEGQSDVGDQLLREPSESYKGLGDPRLFLPGDRQ
jgi:hypothetical protein